MIDDGDEGRSTPRGLTLRQAVAQAKAHMKAHARHHRKLCRQATILAEQGRGRDTEVAHVALGEIVVPRELQNPDVMTVLRRAAASSGMSLEKLCIGNAMNRINPNTGMREFGSDDGIELDPLEPATLPKEIQKQLDRDRRAIAARGSLVPAALNPYVQAGLDTIQKAEGGAPYIRIGGSRAKNLDNHPGSLPRERDDHGNFIGERQSAAGSFQITEDTWNRLKDQYGFTDFSEPNQRLAAIALLKERGALSALRDGNIERALPGASKEWSSLPMGRAELDKGAYEKYRAEPAVGQSRVNPNTGSIAFSPKFRIVGENIAKPYDTISAWYQDSLRRQIGR